MIQIIASIIVAIVYFKAAREQAKSGLGWSLIGLAAMFIPSIVWAIIARQILPELIGRVRSDGEAFVIGIAIGGVGVTAGIIASVGVYNHHLKIDNDDDQHAIEPAPNSTTGKIWHCGCGEVNLNMAQECRMCGNTRPKGEALEMA